MGFMRELALHELHEWAGQWWLPEAPHAKVAGILRFTPGGEITLTLIGTMLDGAGLPVGFANRRQDEVQTMLAAVHGVARGEEITMLGAWVASEHTHGPHDLVDLTTEVALGCLTVLVGCHLAGADESVFVGAASTIENLTAWSGLKSATTGWDDAGRPLRYEPVAPLVAQFEDVTAALHNNPSFSSGHSRVAITNAMSEHTSIRLTSPSGKTLRQWLDLLAAVADLISLATLSACAAMTLRAFLPPRPGQHPEGHPLREQPREVWVLQRRIVTPVINGKVALFLDFVLTPDDLAFSELYPRWMAIHDRFASARAMVLGLRYITEGYLETRVMSAVSAAESMHRALETPPPIPADEFRRLRGTLLDAVPAERRQWLASILERNEPSLRMRLLDLVSRVGPAATDLLPNPAVWARAATTVRNGLAHAGRATRSTEELHAVVEVTSAVIVLNFLAELGVPQARMRRAIQENEELAEAARLARKVFGSGSGVQRGGVVPGRATPEA